MLKRKTLTATGVARVRPPDNPQRRRMDWDALVPGLALRTTATGSKSWVLVTRFAGKVVFSTLGKPPGIGVPKARELAKAGLERVSRGEHPRQRLARKPHPSAGYFEQVAADFVERHAKVKTRTWKQTQRILQKYIMPILGTRRLAEIARKDVSDLMDSIAADHGPIQANRALAAVKKLFAWALDKGLIETHPVARLSPPATETERERVLTEKEIKSLWNTWLTMGYPWGAALQLLLLTATRRGEVEAMAWEECDGDVWMIPSERNKVKRPHMVPLSPAALDVLAKCPRFEGTRFVFTTRKGKHIGDWSSAVATATEKSGVTGWRIHDLRRTARTNFSKLGIQADVAERCLGHVVGGVRGVYDRHDFLNEKRAALEQWAAHLTALVSHDG